MSNNEIEKCLKRISQTFLEVGKKKNYDFLVKEEDKILIINNNDDSYYQDYIDTFTHSEEVATKIVHQLYYNKLIDPDHTNPNLYSIGISRLDINFYEETYMSLSSEDKEIFYETITPLFSLYYIDNHLKNFNNKEFLNKLLVNHLNFFKYSNMYCYNLLSNCLNKHLDNNNPVLLEEETLLLLCKKYKTELKKIEVQFQLKMIVEKDFPRSVEKFRKYYKKADTSNIDESKKVLENQAHIMSFNKVYLHNLNINKPEEKTCLKRLRNLVTYLNKNATKLQLQKVLMDGVGANEKYYNFVFINQNNLIYKEQIKKIILEVAANEACLDVKNIERTINFILLNDKIKESNQTNKKTLKL